jgi:hypothetical protein
MFENITIKCVKLTAAGIDSFSIVLAATLNEYESQIRNLKNQFAHEHNVEENLVQVKDVAHSAFSLSTELKRIS